METNIQFRFGASYQCRGSWSGKKSAYRSFFVLYYFGNFFQSASFAIAFVFEVFTEKISGLADERFRF